MIDGYTDDRDIEMEGRGRERREREEERVRNSSDVMNVSIIKLYCIGVIVGPTSLLYSTKGFFTPTVIYPSTGAMLISGRI